MVSKGLSLFADCINSIFFGQVCDTCDGAAIYSLLAAIIRTFTIGVGILAVIGIMITGIQYLKSSGNPEKKNKARSRLINVGIGIIIYIALFGIAEFFVPGGVIAHPIASTDETASCPEITYTDTTIRRPENPGNADGTSPDSPTINPEDMPSPYFGTTPKFTTEIKKGGTSDEYNYLEIRNATPYVYMPKVHNNFETVLDNINKGAEGKNIIIIANAGEFFMGTGKPKGITIQDGKVFSSEKVIYSTLVVDEDGNIGFVKGNSEAKEMLKGNVPYINGITGQIVSGKKIVSAVSHFTPILVNGESAKEKGYFSGNPGGHYNSQRKRQIICIKADTTNAIITGKNDSGGKGPNGWDYEEMVKITKENNCKFAFNLDGGGSTSTAWRNTTDDKFDTDKKKNIFASSTREIPSYIVYTDNNLPPDKTIADYQSDDADLTPTENYNSKSELLTHDGLQYWLNVPEGATDKMPLVIFLHGSGERGDPNGVKGWQASKEMCARKDFISIIPVLHKGGYWSNVTSKLKAVIDKTVSDYKINQQKINIFGFSLGGTGTWTMVNKNPSLFASAVPISGDASITPANFKNTPIRAIAGSEEPKYIPGMQGMVNSINNAGGKATFETVAGKNHGGMQFGLDYKSIFDWMLGKTNSKAQAPAGSKTNSNTTSTSDSSKKTNTTSADRSYIKGTSPWFYRHKGEYKGVEYNYIDIFNAIPYVYYDKLKMNGNSKTIFGDRLQKIAKKESNILIIANAYLNVGIIATGGQIVYKNLGAHWLHQDHRYGTLAIDENGIVGYMIQGEMKEVGFQNAMNGNVEFHDIYTGSVSTGHKIESAVTAYGIFYLNGEENKIFTNGHKNARQRQIICFRKNGSYTILSLFNSGLTLKDYVGIAKNHNCDSAFSLDGGGSVQVGWRQSTKSTFKRKNTLDEDGKERDIHGFIVFTSDNNPPYVK